jgi:hypothetical protein
MLAKRTQASRRVALSRRERAYTAAIHSIGAVIGFYSRAGVSPVDDGGPEARSPMINEYSGIPRAAATCGNDRKSRLLMLVSRYARRESSRPEDEEIQWIDYRLIRRTSRGVFAHSREALLEFMIWKLD